MNIAIIGLGKMGEALAYRATKAGNTVYGFDVHQSSDFVHSIQNIGVTFVNSINDFSHYNIDFFWLMVPQGILVDTVIAQLNIFMKAGSIIVDGGNSKFTDSMRRAQELIIHNIFFLDCGTSGGVHGRENGFCLMVGGDKSAYDKIASALCSVAVTDGCEYVGASGAGHYVKMVHNGIEYGLLQAYAEGFDLLKNGEFKNQYLDLEKIAYLWNHGSVIRSWILELVYEIMKEDQDLKNILGKVAATGMGEWTVERAHISKISVSVIEQALKVRIDSEKDGGNYATKIVAMLRNKFGGHAVTKKLRGNNNENN
jgi:6-phosphogluconate dehydrogenase